MINVAIVEDEKFIRDSLADMLSEAEGFECSGRYVNCEKAIEDFTHNKPDVILMDIELPGMSGIEGVKRIKAKYPKIDIVMLSVHEDITMIFDALTAGASGYLDKSAPEGKILDSIKEIYDGGAPMSYKIA